ncbi:RluA family pseudouridine synthase [Neobacillus sp. Marseille-QA0830]
MIKTARLGDWFQIIIPEIWEGKTLDDIFRGEWAAPKKLIHTFRMERKVRIDGITANWQAPLHSGAKLQVLLFEPEEIHIKPVYHEIGILYEDDHLIVFNKPPFMNTHPNDPEKDTDTLLNAGTFYLLANGDMRNIRQIHRLDRDTTGAILFAKHHLAGSILDRMLTKREIKRTYVAAVHGVLRQKSGVINLPIGRDRHHGSKRIVSSTGQHAITHYQVIKKDETKQISFVKCWLETGRTHQIRVHLSHLGHPLAGDTLYGGEASINRQALHAAKLEFLHPFTQETITCHAPVPDHLNIFESVDIDSI